MQNKKSSLTKGDSFLFSFTQKTQVPGVGVEPTCLTAADFKSTAYTNSATRALLYYRTQRPGAELNRRIFLLQRNALPLGYQAVILI